MKGVEAVTIESPKKALFEKDDHGPNTFVWVQSRLKSYQYWIILLTAILLFGAVIFFAFKDSNEHNGHYVETKDFLIYPNTKCHSVNDQQGEGSKLKQQSELVKNEDDELYSGGIILKTPLENMKCVHNKLADSITCCGKFPFLDTNSDNNQAACILMDTYEDSITGLMYRFRFIIGDNIIINEESVDFPKPNKKCYPMDPKDVSSADGKKLCLELDFKKNQTSHDTNEYKSCTYIPFISLKEDEDNLFLHMVNNVDCQNIENQIVGPETLMPEIKLTVESDGVPPTKKTEIENVKNNNDSQNINDNLSINNPKMTTYKDDLIEDHNNKNVETDFIASEDKPKESTNEGPVKADHKVTYVSMVTDKGSDKNYDNNEFLVFPLNNDNFVDNEQKSNFMKTNILNDQDNWIPNIESSVYDDETGFLGTAKRILRFIKNTIKNIFY